MVRLSFHVFEDYDLNMVKEDILELISRLFCLVDKLARNFGVYVWPNKGVKVGSQLLNIWLFSKIKGTGNL